jgi:hypothetical protein
MTFISWWQGGDRTSAHQLRSVDIQSAPPQ